MDETSGCGVRRALNARERSGDATSGDERRRGEARAKPVERGKSEAQVRDFCSGSVTPRPRTKCSRKAGVVLQAYRLTSFCEARLLLELRVDASGAHERSRALRC